MIHVSLTDSTIVAIIVALKEMKKLSEGNEMQLDFAKAEVELYHEIGLPLEEQNNVN